MKAVVFEQCGNPSEVLQVKEVEEPSPGRGEVLVRMLASPINPSDLLYSRGVYGKQPVLPGRPGFEGVGVVEKSGGGILGKLVVGRRVAVLNGAGGNWAEKVVIPARQAVRVPSALSDEQVATFFVNPATAWVMTRSVLKVPRGEWLLQSAAGSALGRMIIRLARAEGFRTLNIVRRREAVQELLDQGADAVVCTADEDLVERVQELTGGEGVRYAIDPVGGALTGEMIRCLGSGARLLLYGTLALEPVSFDPRLLIAGQKRMEGFWLSEWVRQQGVLGMLRLFNRVAKLIQRGILATEIGETYSLERVAEAARVAEVPGRTGKVLLRIAPG